MLREAGAHRGARADRVAAGALALLLRHRLRHPRRAHRQRRSTSRACAAPSAPTRLGYISLEGLVAATEQPRTRLCTACFTASTRSRCPRRRCSASTCSRLAGPDVAREPRTPRRSLTVGYGAARRLTPALTRTADPAVHRRPVAAGAPRRMAARPARPTRPGRRQLRRRRGRHRRGRAGRRGAAAARREGQPARGPRRHRRLRRAVRAAAGSTASRCSPRPPTASAPRSRSRRPLDKHDTVGLDLVAMVVDDLVVCGAEPLFLQDYIAVGKVVPEQVAAIVAASPRAAGRPAARCSAARPPSTRA